MPRVSFRDYMTPGARPWWDYVGDAGQQVAQGFRDVHAEKQRESELQRAEALRERELQIQETRAKSQLLRESNTASVLGEREASKAADREAVVQGFKEMQQGADQRAVEDALHDSVKSVQGALGPFGLLNPRFIGNAAKGLAESQQRFAPKIELAKRMSPPAAREFLTKEAADEKSRVTARAYQQEAEAILAGVKDGVIDPTMGKSMTEALQGAIRTGRSPGPIHAQVAKAYDLHNKLQKRLAGWEETDAKAGELVGMLQKMADSAEVPSLREKLRKKVADAKGEWGRTRPQSFREKHDGEESLRGLEAILFGAQAAKGENPSDPTYVQDMIPKGSAGQEISKSVAATAPNRTASTGKAPKYTGSSGGSPAAGPMQGQDGTAGGYRQITAKTRARDMRTLRGIVADDGPKVIQEGGDRAALVWLLKKASQELGLDPRDPELVKEVKLALHKLAIGEDLGVKPGPGAFSKKPKAKSGPTVGEALSHLHPGAGGM